MSVNIAVKVHRIVPAALTCVSVWVHLTSNQEVLNRGGTCGFSKRLSQLMSVAFFHHISEDKKLNVTWLLVHLWDHSAGFTGAGRWVLVSLDGAGLPVPICSWDSVTLHFYILIDKNVVNMIMLPSHFFLIGQVLQRQQRHFETTSGWVYKQRQQFSYCHAGVNANVNCFLILDLAGTDFSHYISRKGTI